MENQSKRHHSEILEKISIIEANEKKYVFNLAKTESEHKDAMQTKDKSHALEKATIIREHLAEIDRRNREKEETARETLKNIEIA